VTEAFLAGKPWNRDIVDEAAEVLIGEATPISDHRASAAYRSAMLGASLRKFFSENPAANSLQEVGAS
jgi:xanthine dehydrogenase small subunit